MEWDTIGTRPISDGMYLLVGRGHSRVGVRLDAGPRGRVLSWLPLIRKMAFPPPPCRFLSYCASHCGDDHAHSPERDVRSQLL